MQEDLNSKLIKITDEISYLDASEDPISSNVVFIKPKNSKTTWIFDVGMTSFAAQEINAVQGKKIVVISHFHPDHLFNINRISYDELYLSAHTFKYAKKGIVVKNKEFSVDSEPPLSTASFLEQSASKAENPLSQAKVAQPTENPLSQAEDAQLAESPLPQAKNAQSTEDPLLTESTRVAPKDAQSTESPLSQAKNAQLTEDPLSQAKVAQPTENPLLTESTRVAPEDAQLTENSLSQAKDAQSTENPLAQAKNSLQVPQNPKIKIMELPSSHAKGSLMLQYGDYVFTGDGTYCTTKKGEHVYNANLLFDEIQTLEKLDCKYLCLSHDKNFVQKKESVLSLHKNIYSRRKSNEAYISVEDFFDSKGNVIEN